MKNQVGTWILLFFSAACFCGCGTNKFEKELATEEAAIKLHKETVAGQYDLISTDELKNLLSEDKDPVLLLDAMPSASSYDKGHISGAVNFEFPKEVMTEWDDEKMGGKTKDDYAKMLGEDKDVLIIVYCGYVKCARSHNAALFAKELGFKNVKRYPGGIHAWRGAGHSLSTQ